MKDPFRDYCARRNIQCEIAAKALRLRSRYYADIARRQASSLAETERKNPEFKKRYDAVHANGMEAAARIAKALTPRQRVHMRYGRPSLPHHRTIESLVKRGLLLDDEANTLTPLGEAVSRVLEFWSKYGERT